jgi:hypothetical protein
VPEMLVTFHVPDCVAGKVPLAPVTCSERVEVTRTVQGAPSVQASGDVSSM